MALILAAVAFVVLLRIARRSFVSIPNTQYGVVERTWSARRGPEPFGPLALGRNAGFVPEVLRGGWHVFLPFGYRVHRQPLINVDQIACLVARVGRPLKPGQALGEWPAGAAVDDARGLLQVGGQAGPQRRILRSGTHALNTALFAVITEDSIHHIAGAKKDDAQFQMLLAARDGFQPVVISDDRIGVVTVQDGPALQHGEIIAEAEAYAAKARAEAVGGTENLIRQAVLSALVEIVRDSKTPLVPSVMVGGEAGSALGGLPGLLLAMASRDGSVFGNPRT